MTGERSYRILVKDFVLPCSIGAYPRERLQRQRVRFNVDLRALWPSDSLDDDLTKVVNYKDITAGIRQLVEEGHINLVETLAERIADLCLADPRVLDARVCVEKLEVEPAAAGIGVEIERHRAGHPAVADIYARPGGTDPSRRSGSGEH
jgi:7,8-dihydroneopterin aldolase/epimerase/oxygenase